MKILVAPNSMKGSLSAFDFADIVEKAFLTFSSDFEIRKVPVADGGDETGEVLSRAFLAKKVEVKVKDPLGRLINSTYSVFDKTAIIEMANASGMKLMDATLLNPMLTSSFGTGQLILDAIEKGCTEIFLAIGGSATVDGGMGMMEALGFKFLDKKGKSLTGNGANLSLIKSIIKSDILNIVSIKIICDVDNLLLGKNGAAAVFGPQKGATPQMVKILDSGLKNWSTLVSKIVGETFEIKKGIGAAGGISLPLLAFGNAELVEGAEFVLSKLKLEKHIKWADLIITGEGKIDAQTLHNKAPFVVATWAKRNNKPVYAIAGTVEKNSSNAFDGAYSITNETFGLIFAMENAGSLLSNFALEFAKKIKLLNLNKIND